MKITTALLFAIVSLLPNLLKAQVSDLSRPFNTHYFFHMYTINPAYIGQDGHANAGLSYKKENGYLTTAGSNVYAYVHGKSEAMKGGGFGLIFNYKNKKYGELNYNQYLLGGTASYNWELMDLIDLKVGITTSLLRFTNNLAPISTGGTSLPTNEKFAKVNVDAGILLALENFEFGVAMHHNNQPEFQFFSTSRKDIFQRELFITASYSFEVMDEFKIRPNLIIQQEQRASTVGKDILGELTLLGDYKDLIFAGFSYMLYFDADKNPNATFVTREDHKLRLTAAGKLDKQFLIAASVDIPTTDNKKMQFETSIGYFFNRGDN